MLSLSQFITAAFLVFGLIRARTILASLVGTPKEQLGARFKDEDGRPAPWPFRFCQSSSCSSSATRYHRSLLLWVPPTVESPPQETQKLLSDLGRAQLPLASRAGFGGRPARRPAVQRNFLQPCLSDGRDAAWILVATADDARRHRL